MGGTWGGEVGHSRALRGRLVLATTAMAALAICPGIADAFDARAGWSPVQSVAGYRLYVRQGGQTYGSGVDVGLVQADPDGVVHYVTRGLPNGVVTYFAVTAYDMSGRESPLSDEISVLVTATPTGMSSPVTAAPSLTPTAGATATRTPTAIRTATPVPTAPRMPTATPSPTSIAGSGFTMSGHISYYAGGAPVPDATLTLQGTSGVLATTSDSQGQFGFAGVVGGSWELEPQKLGDFNNAVSALDAAYILEAVSGLRQLEPSAALACDVTGDGTLSAVDAARILQYDVGVLDRFPVAQACESDWVFVPEPLGVPLQRLVPPQSNAMGCQRGGIAFQPLQSDVAQQNFVAALYGDCTGNWREAASGASLRLHSGEAQVQLGVPSARPGGRWAVRLYVLGYDPLEALTAHVDYDPAEVELDSVRLVGPATGAMLHYRADPSGLLSVALASAQPLTTSTRPLLALVFRAAAAPQVRLRDALLGETPARVAD